MKYAITLIIIIITTSVATVILLWDDPEAVWNRLPDSGERTMKQIDRMMMVKRGIIYYARQREFRQEQYAVDIACCEGTLGEHLDNDNGLSKDRGYYHLNDWYHRNISDECAYDLECSVNYFMDMVEAGRQSEWMCDRIIEEENYSLNHCWI